MSELAIKVESLNKMYKLYDKPSDRLKESLGLSRAKKYREHFALKNIDLDVRRGETVGIIGTNGSGKSTLLKIITGVLSQTSGDININGRISALLELGAGFNMEYTGIENVYLNGTMIGFSKEEVDAKLDDILEFADIGEFINQPVKTYSSGMFVRLAFAVSINIDPDILIVDEALSVGDVFFQAKCYHKFEEFKKLGKTILFVSHDLSSISKYCDRVVLLHRGDKISEGSPKKIVDMYKKILVNQLDSGNSHMPEESVKIQEVRLWKENFNLNPQLLEYGDGRANIVDFAVEDEDGNITASIIKGTQFTIKMKVRFQSEISEPIFAFTIKDLKGTEITGTNSMLEKVFTETQKEGEIREIHFKQTMNLQGGEYLLSLGCTGYGDGNFTVYHRLYDIINISVISDKDSVGFYDMFSQLDIY